MFQQYNYFIIEDAYSRDPNIITDSWGYIEYFNSFEDAKLFAQKNELKNYIICDEIAEK